MNVKYTDILLSLHMSIFLCSDFFHCPPPKWNIQIICAQNKNIFLLEVNELVILKVQCGNILMFHLNDKLV